MNITRSPENRSGDAGPDRRSQFRRLVHFYTSPGDRTPASVGVAIGLLAAAGLIVLGPTSQWWLLACAGLLAYAIAAVLRPVEAWRILRGPAEEEPPAAGAAPPDEPAGAATPDESGWLPTRESDGR